MSWLTLGVLCKRNIWPQTINYVSAPQRIVVYEKNQFVVYEEDTSMSSGCIFDRGKVFSFGKAKWFHRAITDREALEAAIAYAKEAAGISNPYRAMANEIIEIQDLVNGP